MQKERLPNMGHTRYRYGRLVLAAIAVSGLWSANLLFCPISNSYADQQPFVAGERLTFRLRWTVVPAGEAVMEVLPMATVNGKPAYHFRLTATSNAFVDMFFKVRDCIDAYTNVEMTHALRYHHSQQEGKSRKHVQVEFDWQSATARYFNGKKHKMIDLPPGTFDPLSAFYFTRMGEFKAQGVIICPVSDGNKCVDGQVRIIKKERVTVFNGTYETYLIEPDLKHVGGVFEKEKNAKIKIWVTADEHRIPVKIASKVSVGSFVGELISIEGSGPLHANRSTGYGQSAQPTLQ
jgi:hypothetical protein